MIPNNRDLSRWQVDGQPFALECTGEVVAHLRRWTLTADLFPPDRGMLWGTREGHTVRVLEVSQHAVAEHSKPQIALGWFQVRLETDIHLTREDLLYCDEKFPQTGATVLILRPASAGGVRVGVFFREASGAMRTESSYQEVVLHGDLESPLPALPAPATIDPPPVRMAPIPVAKTRRSKMWVAFLTGTLAGAFAGALAFDLVRHEPAKAPIPDDTTRALTQQTRQLQSELDAEKLHNRRLEATLAILRDRARSKSSPIAQTFATEAKALPADPVF